MKKRNIWERALGLYGRLVLSTVLGIFMWISVSIITTALMPDGTTLTLWNNLAMNVIALIIQGFLFGTIVLSYAWQLGDKDGAKDMFKNRVGDAHFGLKMSLVAAIPSLTAWALLLADRAFALFQSYSLLYRVFNGALYPIIVWTMGFTLGKPLSTVPWVGVILSILPTLITVAIAWVGYWVGYKQIPLMKKIMYKNKDLRK